MLASNLNQLLETTSGIEVAFKSGTNLEQRLTGRFYTHERIGKAMALDIADRIQVEESLRVIDPFCGDGRLICWLLDALRTSNKLPIKLLKIVIWDCDSSAVAIAERSIQDTLTRLGIKNYTVEACTADSFERTLKSERSFDVCITNPPWEYAVNRPTSPGCSNYDLIFQAERQEFVDAAVWPSG